MPSPLPKEPTLERLPPELVFTTMLLGGFRGILINFLWMRAMELKDRGEYFELVQLSDWIGLLEPHIPEVWVFNAWNLSYNISVKFPPPERWHWVHEGISLLRDRALTYIPDSPEIYQEISWIFYHKISSPVDEAHAYYKREWAKLMRDALGNTPLKELASPPSYKELIEDENVQKTVSSFQKEGLNIFKDWEKISKDGFLHLPQRLKDYLAHPSFLKIETYMRSKILRDRFRLNPEFMMKIEDKYVPFDWKSASAHSLYWIEVGKKNTKMREIDYSRMVYFSLIHLLEGGRIDFKKIGNEEIILTSPQLNIAPILNDFYEKTLQVVEEGLAIGVRSSHLNFLRKVILLSYIMDDLPFAHQYYQYMKERYPEEIGGLSFSEYISSRLVKRLKEASISEIASMLFGFLYQAYWYLAVGVDERYVGLKSLAQIIYNRASIEQPHFQKLFPTFESLKESVFRRAVEEFPPPLSLSLRKRLGKEELPPL